MARGDTPDAASERPPPALSRDYESTVSPRTAHSSRSRQASSAAGGSAQRAPSAAAPPPAAAGAVRRDDKEDTTSDAPAFRHVLICRVLETVRVVADTRVPRARSAC